MTEKLELEHFWPYSILFVKRQCYLHKMFSTNVSCITTFQAFPTYFSQKKKIVLFWYSDLYKVSKGLMSEWNSFIWKIGFFQVSTFWLFCDCYRKLWAWRRARAAPPAQSHHIHSISFYKEQPYKNARKIWTILIK